MNAALDTFILPRLLCNRPNGNELRIWSAGCSTGQEAYSLAMMLSAFDEKLDHGIFYRIIATDHSEEALHIARQGGYELDTLQNIPLKYFNRYVVKSGDQYNICEDLKRHVSFTWYDLLDFYQVIQEVLYGR
jgi:chemotaxis methyl-accepting protein methylase